MKASEQFGSIAFNEAAMGEQKDISENTQEPVPSTGRISRLTCIAALVVFLISLFPIFITGLHARPSIDDYMFVARSTHRGADGGRGTHYIERSVRYAVQNGGVIDVARAAARTVSDNYRDWQGTFTAIALMALHPGVLFGEAAYPITMVFTLFALVAATAFLMRTVLPKRWLLPSILLLTISIQWIPDLPQAFFWWNGGTFYTFFYSVMLANLALKISLFREPNKRSVGKIILITALDFLIGGGNFVTALFNLLLNFVILFFVCIKSRRKAWAAGLFSLASLAGLLISALAPGNAIRQSAETGLPVAETILSSIAHAAEDIFRWTTPVVVLLLVLAAMIAWRLVKELDFDFPYPLLVLTASFLLFASQYAPPLYAMSDIGPGRLRNIVYYAYVWFLFGNVFYLTGWVRRHVVIYLRTGGKYLRYAQAGGLCFLLLVLVLGYPSSSAALCVRDLQAGLPLGSFLSIQAVPMFLWAVSVPWLTLRARLPHCTVRCCTLMAFWSVQSAMRWGERCFSAYAISLTWQESKFYGGTISFT